MQEVLRTNNPVQLSFAEAVLKDAGIASFTFDTNMSVMEGGVVILPRRLMVADEQVNRAKAVLAEAFAADARFP
jgi:hypothetical protein